MDEKRNLLIVDDEKNIVGSMIDFLEADHNCFGAFNVDDAIEILKKEEIDLVFSDIRMPKKSGFELLQWLKKNRPRIKVVMMTAFGSSSVKQAAKTKGAVYYMEKPIDLERILKLIERAFQPKGFVADIKNLDLIDMLQVLTFSGKNCTLLVKNSLGDEGKIFIRQGNVLDSETEFHNGIEAFYDIVKWEGGTFRTTKLPEDIHSNISAPIEHLLLEASRIKDESERKYQEAEKNAKNGDFEKFLQKLLSELNNCDGLCYLNTKTDEIISLANSDKYGLDKLTREISTTDNKDGKSFTGDILITTDKSYLVITRIDDTDYWISVILLKPANIGLNHLLISKHKPLLAQILSKA